MALPHREDDYLNATRPYYEVEGTVIDFLVCEVCGTYWSVDPDEYHHLNDDDSIRCSCGNVLCEKKDLT